MLLAPLQSSKLIEKIAFPSGVTRRSGLLGSGCYRARWHMAATLHHHADAAAWHSGFHGIAAYGVAPSNALALPHICPGFFAVSGDYIPSRYLVLYHIFNEIASCIMIHKLSRILGRRFQALIYNADSNAYRRDRDDFTLHEYSLTFRAQNPPENVCRRKWFYRSRWSVRNPQVGNPIIQSQI